MFKVEKAYFDNKIENNLKFFHMVLYQSASWRGIYSFILVYSYKRSFLISMHNLLTLA
jgi:hypothetical protein